MSREADSRKPNFGSKFFARIAKSIRRDDRMLPRWFTDQITALRLLFVDSALPGLKVICGFGSPIRRGAWLLVFLALFGLTIRDIINLAVEYYKFPDSLNIKYEEPEQGRQMPMPAITVCNLNPYKWRVFCEELDSLLAMR